MTDAKLLSSKCNQDRCAQAQRPSLWLDEKEVQAIV